MAQSSPTPAEVLRQLQSRPLCIICGRPKEAEAIAKELGVENNRVLGREIDKINDGHSFFTGSFDIRGQKLDYYITSSLRQGIQSFTIHASILFHILKPRFAIHVGVCAAFYEVSNAGQAGEVPMLARRLTDVIFGEAAVNYEEGKWEKGEGDKEAIFSPDYDLIRTPTGDMQAFADSNERPQYHYGDYISGSAVRHDASVVFRQIKSNVARNAIALDMEASAFLKLCSYAGVSSLGVVKGISDFGDSAKGKEPDAYDGALRNTAIGLREWVIHTIPAVDWQLNEDDQKGVSISVGYYDNFVRVVLDAYSQGMPAKKKVTSFKAIPWEDVRGLKIIMPKSMNPDFFAEAGQIGRIMREYGVLEVDIGGYNYSRSLYYKAGYLVDFPRTINSLAQDPDATHQVDLFAKRLRQRQYFSSPVKEKEALAQVCQWDEFIDWLKALKEDEVAYSSAKTEQAFPIKKNGKESNVSVSLVPISPLLTTSTPDDLADTRAAVVEQRKDLELQTDVPNGDHKEPDTGETPKSATFPQSNVMPKMLVKRKSIWGFLRRKSSRPMKTM